MFQSDGNPRCADSQETVFEMCPACARTFELAYMAKHHIKGKATKELRYNEEFAIRLCALDCHRECEDIGNKAFAEKHAENLQMYAPHKYIILLHN